MREKKRSKGRMKNRGISINEASPGSAEQPKKKVSNFLIAIYIYVLFQKWVSLFLIVNSFFDVYCKVETDKVIDFVLLWIFFYSDGFCFFCPEIRVSMLVVWDCGD